MSNEDTPLTTNTVISISPFDKSSSVPCMMCNPRVGTYAMCENCQLIFNRKQPIMPIDYTGIGAVHVQDSKELFQPVMSTGDEDMDKLIRDMLDVMASKGKDYTVGTKDRLHNFRTVGQFTGQHPLDVLGVYMYKHISAIYSYIKSKGQNESEPIEQRIIDAMNYLLLMHKMVCEMKKGNI